MVKALASVRAIRQSGLPPKILGGLGGLGDLGARKNACVVVSSESRKEARFYVWILLRLDTATSGYCYVWILLRLDTGGFGVGS
jgi:hypothetical protein